MAKQVLVIGGSYFLGRVFSIFASRAGDPELHLVNRGRLPLNKEGVHEYRCDRHDVEKLASIVPDVHYDALVDFCAYNPGEISPIVEVLHDRIGQYIYVGTASVYDPNESGCKVETDTVIYESDDDVISQYVCGKAILETELIESCKKHGIPYTIIRPSCIYGPFNYAPRESWFIEKIMHGKPVERITDSTSHFSFVYVGDVANAITACIGDERAYDEIFNISAPEVVTYDVFYDELRRWWGKDFPTIDVTVRQTYDEGIGLPYPLDNDELSDGTKFARTFGFEYTPLSEGLDKAFNAFKNVYEE